MLIHRYILSKIFKERNILKKVLIASLLAATVIGSGMAHASSSLEHPSIYVNGQKSALNGVVPPSGSTMVPFRPVFDLVGMNVSFDDKTKILTATKEGVEIKLQAGSLDGYVNGKKVHLNQTPGIENNVFYVNLRFIIENAGGSVTWKKISADDAEIRITLPE